MCIGLLEQAQSALINSVCGVNIWRLSKSITSHMPILTYSARNHHNSEAFLLVFHIFCFFLASFPVNFKYRLEQVTTERNLCTMSQKTRALVVLGGSLPISYFLM